jgi:GlpG protein
MRAIGTVANEQDARRLGAHLLTLGITSQMDSARDGIQVWIHDEDKVERAKQELANFLQNPADPRYDAAEKLAQQVRSQQAAADKQYQRNVRDIRSQWRRPSPKGCPLTLSLIAACLLVAIPTRVGRQDGGVLNHLFITKMLLINGKHDVDATLPEIRRGEVWRLITPIFIHFKELHLLFNLWCLFNLGGVIEIRRGSWRLALLVVASAVISNLVQFAFTFRPWFGGMSGVLYALFGYAWMKSRFEPSVGMYVPPDTVIMMIGWLFLCMTGLVGNIANHAHVAGLIVGVVTGYAPTLWRKLMRS